uniref:Head decoration protein n=1 Tax=viral metagenome TaxID=1070528 RepID=A0A6M3LFM6_9ZZZZ
MTTTHTMEFERIPGAMGTTGGYFLAKTKQATAAAVANDDILKWCNVADVIIIGIQSEVGDVFTFDAKDTTSPDIAYTVDASVLTTSTAATRVEGLVLVKL